MTAGSGADKAGLRAGDELLSADRKSVLSASQARGMLRDPPDTLAQHAADRLLRGLVPLGLRRTPAFLRDRVQYGEAAGELLEPRRHVLDRQQQVH
ncbi:MAG: PDZ domain-containing protein, partial [Myxococcales bacterium]